MASENRDCSDELRFPKKYDGAIRILWFFIIPVMLFYSSFPSPLDKNNLAAPTNGYTHVEYVNLPAKSFLQELFRIPNLERQSVCFVDNGGTILKGETTLPFDFNWSVNFDNKTLMMIPNKGYNCTEINPNANFTYQWTANLQVSLSSYEIKHGTEFSVTPNTETYSTTTYPNYLLILVLFLIAWYELSKALASYLHFILCPWLCPWMKRLKK